MLSKAPGSAQWIVIVVIRWFCRQRWLSIWPLDVSHDSLPNYLPRVSIVCFIDLRGPQRGKKSKEVLLSQMVPRLLMSQEQNQPATAMDLRVGVYWVFTSITCCFLVDIKSLIGWNQVCFNHLVGQFKLSSGQETNRWDSFYLALLLPYPPHLALSTCGQAHPFPCPRLWEELQIWVDFIFPIAFGKTGNVASLVSALISELKGPG